MSLVCRAYEIAEITYLGSILTNQNYIYDKIKCSLITENSCYYSVRSFCHLEFSLTRFEIMAAKHDLLY